MCPCRGWISFEAMDVTAPLGSYLTPTFGHATVGDAMRPWVLSCDPATPLVTIAQRMAGEHVHAIIVLADHDDRRPYALVTDRDLLRSAARLDELTAGEIATEQVLEARAGEPLSEAARRMATTTPRTPSSSTTAPAARSASSRRSTSRASSAGAEADRRAPQAHPIIRQR